jgi:hypothetical protein
LNIKILYKNNFDWAMNGGDTIVPLSLRLFLYSGHEPIYFIENKEKTLRASYDRGTQIVDYMD